MQPLQTSQEIVSTFSQLSKRETKDAFIFHLIGSPVTFRYVKKDFTLQTITFGQIVCKQTVCKPLSFQDFLLVAHETFNIVIKRNFGDN